MSDNWHNVIPEDELAEGKAHAAIIDGWHIFLIKLDGEIRALNDRCTHAASHLSTGRIRRGAVMCPLHGSRFELKSGRCIGGAYADLLTFEHRNEDGMIQVQLPNRAPTMAELPVAPVG